MRVFLDTNVLVSAIATRGICADVLTAVLAEHQLVLGEVVIVELKRVLEKKMKVPSATVRETEAFLRREAAVISNGVAHGIQLRDPDDVLVLAQAIEGLSEVIVTGDRDLLDESDSIPIDVLTPRQFWERLKASP